MATSLVSADSVLAIDVGGVHTRVMLFDVVEGRYRFLAAASALTTAGATYRNITEGIHQALDQLQAITGRTLTGSDGHLITPSQADGSGVDRCVATLSAGPPLKVVGVGLLEDISAQSVQNLVATTYAQVREMISLNDHRKPAARLDSILRLRPDLVVIAGGTENGASHSVLELMEAVGLACYLMPKASRPEILYAGNSALAEEVKSMLGSLASLYIAPNIRPAVDEEQLPPAQKAFAAVYRKARARQMGGVSELDSWTNGNILPTASAFGRTIRFISKEYARTRKGVLGVDVGSTAVTIAAGFAGELYQSVHPRLGLGENLPGVLQLGTLGDVTRWLPVDVEEDYVRDYIHNKSLYPASLPASEEDLAIEQALACQVLQLAIRKALRSFPEEVLRQAGGLLPAFEPIIASGSVFSGAPHRSQVLMMLLNGLQPAGVTTLALDQNNLAAALGAVAAVNPLLTIQSLDASNFLNLCTVISPVGRTNIGTPVLHVRVVSADDSETSLDVRFGSLEVIQLAVGQAASVQLQPLNRFDVGMGGPGRGGTVKVMGGLLGLVIDARGRPLSLPADPARRREQLKKWSWVFGT